MENHIEMFLEMMMAERGAAKNTIEAYSRDLNEFHSFMARREVALVAATTEDIRAFFKNISSLGLTSSTVSRKLSSVRQFYKFLCTDEFIEENPTFVIEGPKQQKPLPKYLTEEEISNLFNAAYEDKSAEGVRLTALLELLYASGMRVSEIANLKSLTVPELVKLKTTNFNKHSSKGNFLIIKGKGNKERLVPLHKSAIEALEKYLQMREKFFGGKDSQWLFPSTSAEGHLTRQRFNQLLKELARRATIDESRVSPHVFRHSFASHLLNNGADLRTLQELLGHSDISTTQIYTHLLNNKIKKLVMEKHPLAAG
jgi:integrase/recombinase XerD